MIGTLNHLVCKQTLNHLVKLLNWLSCVVSTYLYGAFDYLTVSHIPVLERIDTLQLPEFQGFPSSKQVRYVKIRWLL